MMTRDASGLFHTIHKAIDSASGAIAPAVDHITASAHNTVDKLAGYAAHASDTFSEKSGQLNDARLRVTESARGQVRAKPLAAIGIAVAAGVLVGWLLRKN